MMTAPYEVISQAPLECRPKTLLVTFFDRPDLYFEVEVLSSHRLILYRHEVGSADDRMEPITSYDSNVVFSRPRYFAVRCSVHAAICAMLRSVGIAQEVNSYE